jgi:hypothetical protein
LAAATVKCSSDPLFVRLAALLTGSLSQQSKARERE